jgi:hypothetical protein
MPMAHLPLTYFLLPVSRRLRLAALLWVLSLSRRLLRSTTELAEPVGGACKTRRPGLKAACSGLASLDGGACNATPPSLQRSTVGLSRTPPPGLQRQTVGLVRDLPDLAKLNDRPCKAR